MTEHATDILTPGDETGGGEAQEASPVRHTKGVQLVAGSLRYDVQLVF